MKQQTYSILPDVWILRDILPLILPQSCLICSRQVRGTLICWRCLLPPPLSLSPTCPRCRIPLMGDTCPSCTLFPLPYDSIGYLWDYSGVARDQILAMKYNPSPILARWLGKLLRTTLDNRSFNSEWDRIVVMPSSDRSGLLRGFNQCVIIGRTLALEISRKCSTSRKIPVSNLLRRKRKRAPHSTLGHEDRMKGLKGLFYADKRVRGERILLIDDVITTGASVGAASYALKCAGAISVDVISLARGSIWQRCRGRIFQKLS